jgi:hypothetical protein
MGAWLNYDSALLERVAPEEAYESRNWQRPALHPAEVLE